MHDPHPPSLDPSTFVVLGDGLAAGMGHFGLEGSFQATSFGALVARALGTAFAQPLIEAPGLGDVIGLEPQPTIVPGVRQSTVRRNLPQTADLNNLSVPGFGLDDALVRRPVPPLVDRSSSLVTLTNLILGLPDLEWGPDRGRTQVEYARDRRPTLALVCLGFDTILRATVSGDPYAQPRSSAVERRLLRLLQEIADGLSPTARLVVTTVPDPLDGAYFSTRESAARILKTTPSFLREQWHVGRSDRVPLPTLYAMGYQTMARSVSALDSTTGPGLLLGPLVTELRSAVARTNEAVHRAAERAAASVFDLHGVLARARREGVEVGGRRLTADYLGGLYLLNGAYPGPTLNAVIADDLVRWLTSTFQLRQEVGPVPLEEVAAQDANTLTELASGPPSTDAFLRPRTPEEIPTIPDPPGPVRPAPIQTTYPELQPSKIGCTPAVGVPAAGLADPSYGDPDFRPLEVPAEGLDYTLDLNPELSCFGDALRPVDCPGEAPIVPGLPPFGLCQRTFFGGFLPTTSPLSGRIHVKVSPPDAEGRARFQIRHPGDLHGGAGDLAGSQLFRMPVQHTRVRDLPGLVSSGVLDIKTGRVYDFHYNLQNTNTALYSLLKLNPQLPAPIRSTLLTFPGAPNGGSSWAEFTQRPDGLLDVSLGAHMFVPLGAGSETEPLRFALPFVTPALDAASFVARGTSLHPRIFVTTRPTPEAETTAPELPAESVVELTAHSYATYFGDAFDLHAQALGGGATGRSHLLGRVRAQFGPRTDDTLAVVLQMLPPGGLLGEAPVAPAFLPPGVARGGSGFDTVMHFPRLTYRQSGLASPDDPFNVCTTTVHLPSGMMVGPLLWRGFVVQALFSDLIAVEPCTPADSFNYRGQARFTCGADGELQLGWEGTVFLPYPTGFRFPSPGPGGRPAIVIEGDSRLDPFRAVRAVFSRSGSCRRGRYVGQVERARSPATGAELSYLWSMPRDPARAREARFEYTDHAQGGTFRLTTLTWLDVAGWETVTFGGFGTWSKDPTTLHQVSVQISTAPEAPYVGIQVDGGLVSNADIKPDRRPAA